MTPHENLSTTAAAAAARPGGDLRPRVEALGLRLANALNLVVAALPGRPSGPRAVGETVGMTIVSASRLLKAIGLADPIAVLQAVPGPNPLSKMLDTVEPLVGAGDPTVDEARAAVEEFDALIKDEAGDRGTLRAMLTAWLPDERREFESQRRQTIYKALAELDGMSSEFELSTMILFPSAQPDRLDLVNVQAILGIDRMRPDARLVLGTRRLESAKHADPAWQSERAPTNLDGAPTTDGPNAARLDDFCSTRPAPIVARRLDDVIEYELGPTGFGRASSVDTVLAEVNRGELPADSGESAQNFFFLCPALPTRRAVLDIIVHEDLFPGHDLELVCFDTSHKGPARPDDPTRDTDRRPISERIESLGHGARGARLVEFPSYTALLDHAAERLDLDLDAFRVHRVSVAYALPNRQLTVVFRTRR